MFDLQRRAEPLGQPGRRCEPTRASMVGPSMLCGLLVRGKLSSLAQLPGYLPGLGTLYVNPATLPEGPFLAYDRQGNPVSSVYMVPLRDLRAGKSFNTLATAKAKTDHIDIYYNNGHVGVPV
jgi:hypothetical protein